MVPGPGDHLIPLVLAFLDQGRQGVYQEAWFRWKKSEWKQCIINLIRNDLEDFNAGEILIMAKMNDFEVSQDRYRE